MSEDLKKAIESLKNNRVVTASLTALVDVESLDLVIAAAERCEKLEAQKAELKEWLTNRLAYENKALEDYATRSMKGTGGFYRAHAFGELCAELIEKLDSQDRQEGGAE